VSNWNDPGPRRDLAGLRALPPANRPLAITDEEYEAKLWREVDAEMDLEERRTGTWTRKPWTSASDGSHYPKDRQVSGMRAYAPGTRRDRVPSSTREPEAAEEELRELSEEERLELAERRERRRREIYERAHAGTRRAHTQAQAPTQGELG
jgi:hypothetical protein